jgi:hypothetical protein
MEAALDRLGASRVEEHEQNTQRLPEESRRLMYAFQLRQSADANLVQQAPV